MPLQRRAGRCKRADRPGGRTARGNARLVLPKTAKVNVSASCGNGKIETTDLGLELMGEQSPRRVRGRLNGGGVPVEVATASGRIIITAK